jgi:L-2-hydroxyglutarate oxidase LhgO
MALFDKGKTNGVNVQLINPTEMHKYEPLAHTKYPFLWSPNTAVVDQMAILKSLKKEFYSLGGTFRFNSNVRLGIKEGQVSLIGTSHRARIIINSGGVSALGLAQSIGIANNLRLIPIRGSYKATDNKNLPLRTLVYPIPNPINPFLGVHFTPNIKGEIKLGPTAFPVLGNEQYELKDWPNLSELTRNLSSILNFGIKRSQQSLAILRKEIPYLHLGTIIREARQLVPSTPGINYWKNIQPGIRAQLFNTSTGEFINDFTLEASRNSLHLLNIVSPGFTSAIPLARYSASEAVRLFDSRV